MMKKNLQRIFFCESLWKGEKPYCTSSFGLEKIYNSNYDFSFYFYFLVLSQLLTLIKSPFYFGITSIYF